MRNKIRVALCLSTIALVIGRASAQAAPESIVTPAPSMAGASGGVVRQSLDDAWWTGPMLANSPATLPAGRGYIESYLFDVKSGNTHSINSLTFMQYGLAERLTVGLIPTAGFNSVGGGPDSTGIGIGDLTLMANYRLTKYEPGNWVPTTSIAIQQTLPTGKYDRLGNRPNNGFGSGAYTTTVAFYGQAYFWMPNGRILRSRINVSRSFSSRATVEDISVYGTSTGFRGYATPGASFLINNSWEYSLSRSWVLAVDIGYRHGNKTRVVGSNASGEVRLTSGSTDTFFIAPAVEYSWTPNLGVLLGVRYIPANGNVPQSVTPAIALSVFL